MQLTPDDIRREAKLAYEFDPDRDYMNEVDAVTPAWVPPADIQRDARVPGAALHTRSNIRPTMVRMADGSLRTIPAKRYVRAVDPQGNIHPLSISTVTPGPGPNDPFEFADGFDRLGTETRVLAEKKRRGWLILEPSEMMNGLTGSEYICWALAVAADRRRRHAEYEAQERDNFMSQAARRAMEEQKKQAGVMADAVKGIGAEVAKAVAEAMLNAQSGKKSKATAE